MQLIPNLERQPASELCNTVTFSRKKPVTPKQNTVGHCIQGCLVPKSLPGCFDKIVEMRWQLDVGL